MSFPQVPTVDLSPYFSADEIGKRSVIEKIDQACSEYGCFQIINHGVCLDLMSQALKVSKDFFEFPTEEKLQFGPSPGSNSTAGYNRMPNPEYEFTEYFVMMRPGSDVNIFPTSYPQLREVMEELFNRFFKIASIMEDIVSDCLGLPHRILKEFNNDRSCDLLIALHYLPAKGKETMGINSHRDMSCFTMLIQDDVGGGLEVYKAGQWLPIPPVPGAIIVNIGEILQVLTNDKFKSPSHRAVRPKVTTRNSFAFFHNAPGEKWLEPLAEFTTEIEKKPKYRKFLFKDYQILRRKDKVNPPSRPEDEISVSCYAINGNETIA